MKLPRCCVCCHHDTEQGTNRKRTLQMFIFVATPHICWVGPLFCWSCVVSSWEVYNSHTTTPPYFLVAGPKNMNICHLKAGTCLSGQDVRTCTGVIQKRSCGWFSVSSSASLYNLRLPATCFSMEIHNYFHVSAQSFKCLSSQEKSVWSVSFYHSLWCILATNVCT